MISQKWAKLIKSLQLKKFRKAEQLFFVEGEKAVLEVLASGWPVKALFGTPDFLDRHPDAAIAAELSHPCTAAELEAVGTFASNNAAIAVVQLPHYAPFAEQQGHWVLVLDQINDPGNLGTIIRIADWYGIEHILCSTDTVDAFNPKVIASAKGSFLRVKLHYQPLPEVLVKVQQPVFGAYLGGESVHQLQLPQAGGFIVLGNEANGISAELEPLISRRITIPSFGDAESLNVGIACAVVVDNLKRLSATSV
ncbi:RNA methyltransferase [Rheinheimera sp.]|uniref:TrmH family RNA methyltransferase n=1 Tax=Rheinheimera sp. TaxID=1869214 RepID=UPI0027BB0202|nr:RNA methyltransferase [Rheinheimera sp.]